MEWDFRKTVFLRFYVLLVLINKLYLRIEYIYEYKNYIE